jgi:hypothetical protein
MQAMKNDVGVEVQIHRLTSALDAPAVVPPRRKSPVPPYPGWKLRKRESLSLLPVIEPRFPAVQPICQSLY